MGKLVDIDAVRKAIEEEWDGCCADYNAQEIIDDTIHAVEQVAEVEAIPVDWLMQKADWCDKNNGIFVSGAIRSAVDVWREEQEKDGKSNRCR